VEYDRIEPGTLEQSSGIEYVIHGIANPCHRCTATSRVRDRLDDGLITFYKANGNSTLAPGCCLDRKLTDFTSLRDRRNERVGIALDDRPPSQ